MKKGRIVFDRPVAVVAHASVGGKEESRGPLGRALDYRSDEDHFGRDTWEHAESEIGRIALNLALSKCRLSQDSLGFVAAGDLQNQCVASSEGACTFGIPFLGLFGACSTLGEGMLVASLTLNASPSLGYGAVVTTSHNCAAERQFRTPLEYGGQRKPTAQWTATAGGAYILSASADSHVFITEGMIGRTIDGGIPDAANMGAAMAPAVCDTLIRYFDECGSSVLDFDAIVTGDLGREGSAILRELLTDRFGIDFSTRHRDCGMLLYDYETQDVHSGGSGCGCSASVFSAHFMPELECGNMKNILLLATGALMSPSCIQQGGNIIGIAPLLRIERK